MLRLGTQGLLELPPPRVEDLLSRRLEAQEGQLLGRPLLRAERRRFQGGQALEDLGGAGARDRGLPAPDRPETGGARRGGVDARGAALPALRAGGSRGLRRVAGGARADPACRGGASSMALARGEVSLADAVTRGDWASDRRRGRRADRAGLARRGGAGGGLVRVSAGARAAPLRERDRPGAGGGRAASGPAHARPAAQPVHGSRRVPSRW